MSVRTVLVSPYQKALPLPLPLLFVHPSNCCLSLCLSLSLTFFLPSYPCGPFPLPYSLFISLFDFSVSSYFPSLGLIMLPTPLPHLLFPLGDYGTANIIGSSATCMCGRSSGSSDSKWPQSSTWTGTGVSLPTNLLMRFGIVMLMDSGRRRERKRVSEIEGVRLRIRVREI